VTLAAGLTAFYALPWRCYCAKRRYEPFNTFWRGKIVLEFILGFWAVRRIPFYSYLLLNNAKYFSFKTIKITGN
jgi:hypothetical protein